MKTNTRRSVAQFRILRSLAAALERSRFIEGLHESGAACGFRWKRNALIALGTLIAILPLTHSNAYQAQPAPGAPPATAPAPAPAPVAAPAATTAPLEAVPPPSAPPKLSAAELEKLLMPIALYPDALLATLLPACVYPLEIVQAARFMADPNNATKVDSQGWDESVKAIAKIPAALKKLNDDLQWTIQLGEAFLNQDKDVMDTVQALRMKAQTAGTLRSSEQQVVVVTNMIVEKTVEQQVVVVTNTVVQIQPAPAAPQTIYVPTYPPTVYAPPPAYVYDPLAPLITFGAGVAVGAIIANNCDWGHGGCYWGGGGHGEVDIDVNNNFNQNVNVGTGDKNVNRGNNTVNRGNTANSGNRAQGGGGQKWQPDANRVRSSGSPTSAKTMESRGWGSGGARPGAQPTTGAGRGSGGATASARPSTPSFGSSAGARPNSPSAGARPSTTPSAGARPSSTASTRPSSSSGGSAVNRSAGAAQPSAANRSSGSAFSGGGGGGASQQASSQRGSSSRGGGGMSSGSPSRSGGGGASRGGGGGGGRGGGGGGRR